MWLTARTVRGPWAPRLGSARQLRATASRRELEGGDEQPAASSRQCERRADGLRQHDAGRADRLPRRPGLLLVSAPSTLLWAHNTDSDVFRLGKNGRVYYLVAGRWFSAPDFQGPWTFATPTLPADFARIPVEHARSRVLASVPGTPQAAEAVVLAQLPQTATVDRRQLKAPDVRYQGEPQFVRIESTAVRSRDQHRPRCAARGRPLLSMRSGCLVRRGDAAGRMGSGRGHSRRDLRHPRQLPRTPRHLRHRGRHRQRSGDVCDGAGLQRRDGGVGLRGVGHGLLLRALRLVLAGCIRSTTHTHSPTGRQRGTARGPARTNEARRPMGHTAASRRRRATTRRPASTREARWRGAPTARTARRRRGTRAPAPMVRRVRDRASTAAGDHRMCNAATTGRRPRA